MSLPGGPLACLDTDGSSAGLAAAAQLTPHRESVVLPLAGGAPVTLPDGGECPDVAPLADGRAVVGWSAGSPEESDDGARGPVWLAFAAAGRLGAPVAISGTVRAAGPHVAAGPDGAVAALWSETRGNRGRVVAGGLAPDGTVSAPRVLERVRGGQFLQWAPVADAAADGTVVTAWLVSDLDAKDAVRVAVRPPGGSFGPPRTVARGLDLHDLHVDVAADGATALAWGRADDVMLAAGPAPALLRTGRALRLAGDVAVAAEPFGAATVLGVRGGAAGAVVRRAADGTSTRTDLPVPGAVAPRTTVREGLAGVVTGLGLGSTLRRAGDGSLHATFAVAAARDRGAALGVTATRDPAGAWSPATAVTPTCCAVTSVAGLPDAAGGQSVLAALADGAGARLVTTSPTPLPAAGVPLGPVAVEITATRRRGGARLTATVRCPAACTATMSVPGPLESVRSRWLPTGAGTLVLRLQQGYGGPPVAPRRLRVRVAVCDDDGRVHVVTRRVAVRR